MPLTLGTLNKSISSTYGLIGHYTSTTSGTTHTITNANLGGPSGLLVVLMSTPSPSGTFTATAAGETIAGYRTTNTSGAAVQFIFGRPLATSGDISIVFSNSIADVIFTVFRLSTGATTTRDQAAGTFVSATTASFTGLSISSSSGGSHMFITSTQLNTDAVTVDDSGMRVTSVQSGTVSTIATRRHFWWYGRAGLSTVSASASTSWTNAANAAIMGVSFNP